VDLSKPDFFLMLGFILRTSHILPLRILRPKIEKHVVVLVWFLILFLAILRFELWASGLVGR
jgi:hypothetical protein